MTREKLLTVLPDEYHDGALLNACYNGETLILHIHRCPPDQIHNNPNTTNIIIRFDGVTDLEVFDWAETDEFHPYKEGDFYKPEDRWAINGIFYLDFEKGKVVFQDSVRFCCTDVAVLEASKDELDFSKYVL